MPLPATCRDDEVASKGFLAGSPAHSVVRLNLRAGVCAAPQ
jgi:hypothetical protein